MVRTRVADEERGRDPPARIRVQLEHKPSDRGARFTLDAWTGDLYTKVLEVELDKW